MKDQYLSPQNCACFRLRAAARRITKEYDNALKSIPLKATQFTILNMVQGLEPDSITVLAEHLGMERTALCRALPILERKGLLTVSEFEEGHERRIRITRKGRAVLKKAIPLWEEIQRKFIEDYFAPNWMERKNWLISVAGGMSY